MHENDKNIKLSELSSLTYRREKNTNTQLHKQGQRPSIMAKALKEIENEDGHITQNGQRMLGIPLGSPTLIERVLSEEPTREEFEKLLSKQIRSSAPKGANAYVLGEMKEELQKQREYFAGETVEEDDAELYGFTVCVQYYRI